MADKCCSSKESTTPETMSCCSRSNDIKEVAATSCCGSSNQEANHLTTNELLGCCNSELENKFDHNSSLVNETIAYKIYGMDCPSCALTIEKGLNGLENIQEAKVNYNTAKLQIVGNKDLPLDNIENQVQKLGFNIEPLQQNKHMKIYEVVGMDCGSCAKSIEKHLSNLSSVNAVTVSFATGKMKVEHENSVSDIVSEVAKLGFKASLFNDRVNTNNKEGFKLIILSGLLIALGFIVSYSENLSVIPIFLYAIAIITSGYKPIKSAYYAIKSRSLDMNVLMSAAAIGAVLIGEWFEGATVVWLFALGTALQNRSIEKTRTSIRSLMDLAPSEAWVKLNSDLIKKPVEDVLINEIIVIKPGDRIPLDGVITQGETSVNQAPITGESIPLDKLIGDAVYAGTINESGSIEVKVTKLVEDTTISKIIHLVEEAQEQKAPTQAFIDKFASVYTPIVFILALLVIVVPPLFNFGTWGEWAYKGLALLIVACPCALVISTPVAIVSAIGNAAKHGVLVKGGTFLEKAGTISAIAFDKTGTLTEGKPEVSDINAISVSENDLLSIALTLEEYSTHPIAKTIVTFAKNKGIDSKPGTSFRNIIGKGVQATINGEVHYAGNLRLFEEMNTPLTHIKILVQKELDRGNTVVIVGTSSEIMGIISVSDTIRSTTTQTLHSLKEAGINQVVMLTGDNPGTAKTIAKEANIDRYFAELLPEDKVLTIKQLQSEGHQVAMVGDGINDAPALATSDLGIAMGGGGTDTAMETADIVLMADNLEKLPYTVKLSRKSLKIIKQNIWFSLIVKFIALILIFPGWLTLWMAVLSDTGAAIIVILNALRLLNVKTS